MKPDTGFLGKNPNCKPFAHLISFGVFVSFPGAFKSLSLAWGEAEEDRRGFHHFVSLFLSSWSSLKREVLTCFIGMMHKLVFNPSGTFWNNFFFPLTNSILHCNETSAVDILSSFSFSLPHSCWPSPLFCLPLPPPSCFTSAKVASGCERQPCAFCVNFIRCKKFGGGRVLIAFSYQNQLKSGALTSTYHCC